MIGEIDPSSRFGVYARQSARRADKSEVSTATQLTEGVSTAERLGATSIETYEDLGISAFTGVVRPDFDRLIADCRRGEVDVIVVYYISRLSRLKLMDAIPLVIELLGLGITIVSVTEGTFRQGNMMDLIHIMMRLDQAFAESHNKSVAVLDAKRKARSLGGYVGGKPPFGFELESVAVDVEGEDGKTRKIVIQLLRHNPFEAAIIRQMWATIKKHMHDHYIPGPGRHHPGSINGICAAMNSDGVPTRGRTTQKGSPNSFWGPKTVRRIFSDPRIAGYDVEIVYKKSTDGSRARTIDRYQIKRDPDTMERILRYEPIIPTEEWPEVEIWASGRGQGKGLWRGENLLTAQELLFCECGNTGTGHRTERQAVYRCEIPRGVPSPPEHDGGVTVSMTTLDAYVAERIFALIQTAEGDPETAAIISEATRRFGERQERPGIKADRRAAALEKKEAETALETLYDDREAGGYQGTIGQRRFVESERRLNGIVDALTAHIADLEAASSPVLPIGQWLPEDPEDSPVGEGSWWATASIKDRRDFVTLFVERIEFTKARTTRPKIEERVRIRFHCAT
ncbi:recombinase family protein [Streptomyces uncialis]|uniref:recombinase family protein n=1 Tax=Streptomyces uncialis TaxID=1048205 RepID=UPI002259E720|nr:recombinase family protein [Streptomyces uncialis]MCX4663478.1 recombinase family protein [Streptomyces uncialis]